MVLVRTSCGKAATAPKRLITRQENGFDSSGALRTLPACPDNFKAVVFMLFIKLLHLLCWVYWLGADIGTFYAARFVSNGSLTPAQRATAAKIMLGIDLAPRIAMPLTLATGLHLSALLLAWPLPTGTLWLVWVVCLLWMGTAAWLHHAPRNPQTERVARWDFVWRVALAAGVAVAALLLLWRGSFAPWLAVKLLCFAACVVCGLAIRVHLKDFGPAFAALMQSGATPQVDATIKNSIARCVPYVVLIWVLLLISAAGGLHLF
jgi:hypothetical protein